MGGGPLLFPSSCTADQREKESVTFVKLFQKWIEGYEKCLNL